MKSLFDTTTIYGMTLKNRIVRSATWEGMCEKDGRPTAKLAGVPEEIIQAVLTHADHTGVPRQTRMEKALAACDEITGLITAVALVRPSRSLDDLNASSVKKKWKDRAFAAGANREEIETTTAEFGIELWEHVGNVILAMRRIAPELGFVSKSGEN